MILRNGFFAFVRRLREGVKLFHAMDTMGGGGGKEGGRGGVENTPRCEDRTSVLPAKVHGYDGAVRSATT